MTKRKSNKGRGSSGRRRTKGRAKPSSRIENEQTEMSNKDKDQIDAALEDSYRESGIDWNPDLGDIGAK